MNSKILTTLEYGKIKAALQQLVVTENGADWVAAIAPAGTPEKVQTLLDETADGAAILRLQGGLPVPALVNIRPALKRVDIGAVLNGQELADLSKVLRTVRTVTDFLHDLKERLELRVVGTLGAKLTVLPALERRLVAAVDDDGRLLDDASPALRSIRQSIRSLEGAIRSRMENYTRGAKAKYLSDPIVTIRDDRFVIPVKAEYRGQFGGVVHDQSATGQTLFIEPQAIVDMNNRLREAQIAERSEIERLLAELSAAVAPSTKELGQNAQVLGHLDFINAKARYAKALKATEPQVSPVNHVFLLQARHPLIDPQLVVPNDIAIGADYQAIVVTGPNTGGKTITLKTLGLLQLMGQSGLFIPAAEDSVIGVFANVFADIGDEQSIEQSLSTFSSHMTTIVEILGQMDARTLVLFDELGAGTDPQEGAALAIAILDAVGAAGAYVVASTHYPELKLYGYNTPGTINASMEFDATTLQPTYRLLIGVPGRSNAFDISKRLGLSPTIVESAKALMSADSHDLNDMISDLESQRKAAETEYLETRHELDEATKLHQELQTAYEDFFKERERQLNKAKDQANALIDKAQEQADKIIRDLRQMQLAGQGTIKEDQLIAAKTNLKALHQEPAALPQNRVLRREKHKQALHVGDTVTVLSYGQTGTLLKQVDKTHWEVQVGVIRMKLATSDLQKEQARPQAQAPKPRLTTVKSASGVSATLDLRGQRYDEAMHNLDQYIDQVLLAGYAAVTIIHGLGTGAIRNGVTQYLRRNKQVASFNFAPQNAGGAGATIVTFK